MERQTSVLQEQLGAQVWPYAGSSMSVDKGVVTMSIEDDGLVPAILGVASS